MSEAREPIGCDCLVKENQKAQKELDLFIDSLELNDDPKANRGLLIPTLRKAQDLFGYLSESLQLHVANKLNLHLSEVYGVVSFYSYFSTVPSGKHKISVCTGTACHVKGSDTIVVGIQEKLGLKEGEQTTEDGLFTVEEVSCIGACGLAPVMLVDEKIHGQANQETAVKKVTEILDEEETPKAG